MEGYFLLSTPLRSTFTLMPKCRAAVSAVAIWAQNPCSRVATSEPRLTGCCHHAPSETLVARLDKVCWTPVIGIGSAWKPYSKLVKPVLLDPVPESLVEIYDVPGDHQASVSLVEIHDGLVEINFVPGALDATVVWWLKGGALVDESWYPPATVTSIDEDTAAQGKVAT